MRQDHPAVLRGENRRGPHGAVGLGSRHAQPAAGRDPGGETHRHGPPWMRYDGLTLRYVDVGDGADI